MKIHNVISVILASIMILLIPICIIGMFFNFSLFINILSLDLILIIVLEVFTDVIKTNKIEKIGYSLIVIFYFMSFLSEIYACFNYHSRETVTMQALTPVIMGIGLALVIGGKDKKEKNDDKN